MSNTTFPNYRQYLKQDKWRIKTAAMLALGFDPKHIKSLTQDQKQKLKNAEKKIRYSIDNALLKVNKLKAVKRNGVYYVCPQDFLPWAVNKWSDLKSNLPIGTVLTIPAEGHATAKAKIVSQNPIVVHNSAEQLKESLLDSERRNIEKDKLVSKLKREILELEPDTISRRKKKEGGRKGGINSGKARRGEPY